MITNGSIANENEAIFNVFFSYDSLYGYATAENY